MQKRGAAASANLAAMPVEAYQGVPNDAIKARLSFFSEAWCFADATRAYMLALGTSPTDD